MSVLLISFTVLDKLWVSKDIHLLKCKDIFHIHEATHKIQFISAHIHEFIMIVLLS